MSKNKLKQKCTERVKIFQQAMESCHSSSPMDCIEWFADRIANLEKENAEFDYQKNRNKFCYSCANATERCFKNEIDCPCDKYKSYKDENAELKKQLGMSNKVYNDNLDYSHHIEGQLIKAKRYIKELLKAVESSYSVLSWQRPPIKAEAEQFLNDDGCFDGFCEDCTKDCGIKKLGLVEVEK